MKKLLFVCVAVAALSMMTTACSKPAESSNAADAANPSVPAKAGTAAQLNGSRWLVGDMLVTFKSDKDLEVKGGALDSVAPDGVTGTFTVNNGKVAVNLEVMGKEHTRHGTWDGERLVVDGVPAVRQ